MFRSNKRPKLTGSSWDWDQPFDLKAACAEFGWGDDDWLVGVDEAGRGPVVGSMTYGACGCRIGDHQALKDIGVDDSKALTEERRSEMYKAIEADARLAWTVRDLTAPEISKQQLARTALSLNKISHNAAVEVIQTIRARIPEGQKLVAAFVDVVGPQDSYTRFLERTFPGVVIVVRKKADSRFPVTSGASIMAKVTRDRLVSELPSPLPPGNVTLVGDVGSGYPADPITKRWLKRNTHKLFVLPHVARFDWQPVKDIAAEVCVPVAWDSGSNDLPEYFTSGSKRKRWQYLQEMFLTQPTTF